MFEKFVIGGLLVLGPLATIAYFTVFGEPWFAWVGFGFFCAVIAAAAGFRVAMTIRWQGLSPAERVAADRAEGRGVIWLMSRFAAGLSRERSDRTR